MELKSGYLHPNFKPAEKPKNKLFISYSQFSSYQKCPNYWKLVYIDKIKESKETIHTVFGTAMHTVIQEWITILYTQTVKKSEEYNFDERLKFVLKEEYLKGVEKNNGEHFSSPAELMEFFVDGLSTLNYLRKKRTKYFDKKHEELIGVEVPLYAVIDGTCLISFLDVVIRDKTTGRYRIIDLKTSKTGWSDREKKDEIKNSQLILYKMYFSEIYAVDIDLIDVEYLILKRKVMDVGAYPIPRVSFHKPASGNTTRNKVKKMFLEFIQSSFKENTYNKEREYLAIAGINRNNCRFCEFESDEIRCPKSNRVCLN